MFNKVNTISNLGCVANKVEVECDHSRGLPGINIIGLADRAIEESRERIRSSFKNSQLKLPTSKLIINLLPANLNKNGSGFDLAIALAIAQISLNKQLVRSDQMFYGELDLAGNVMSAGNPIVVLDCAKKHGIKELFLPIYSANILNFVDDMTIYPVKNLQEIINHLEGKQTIPKIKNKPLSLHHQQSEGLKIDQIIDQKLAKRALMIAISGGHHMLLLGSPGIGKSLIAQSATELLPDMEITEAIEVNRLHLAKSDSNFITKRPFRSPHHNISESALVGGGSIPLPGEISLAHQGVLFLDEIAEFSKKALEMLRQPLESANISISRTKQSLSLPADFLLIAAMNPCPCGYYGDPKINCKCTALQIRQYQNKISGPMLDRIDIIIKLHRPTVDKYFNNSETTSGLEMINNIKKAREIQSLRSEKYLKTKTLNSKLNQQELKNFCHLGNEELKFGKMAIDKLKLSIRQWHKTLKIARTIADLSNVEEIKKEHLAEALQFRQNYLISN